MPKKTISQTTLRTHWSRYMREAANGTVIRVRDQAEKPFAVLCQEGDAPEISATIKAGEARDKLSDVFAQVKAGLTFHVVNKRGSEVYMRPFRGYEYPLSEAVRKYWEDRISSELKANSDTQEIEDLLKSSAQSMDEKVDKMIKLVRHSIRESHGLKTYTREQLARDEETDDEI